jgi:metal-responsive CopG/Arc/MetJ family transcriptional regulator
MKTKISIPDEIYHSADQLAKRFGMSRSELYSKAVSEYINSHKNEAVTKALNRIYAKEKSQIDPVIDLMQLRSLPKESW